MKSLLSFSLACLLPAHAEVVLDQFFLGSGGAGLVVNSSFTRSQTMTPSITGTLDSLELPLEATGSPNAPLLLEVLDASGGLGGALLGSVSLQPGDFGPPLAGLKLSEEAVTTTLVDLSSLAIATQAEVPLEIRLSTTATVGTYAVAGSLSLDLYTRGQSYLNGAPSGTDWQFKLFIDKPDPIPLTIEPFAPNQFKLTWPVTLGTYRVLYTDDPSSGAWTELRTFNVVGSSWSFFPTVPEGHPSRYFRVERL